jgi:2',3'-cyclic-nucleotide 2'-phosphodiesterase (5'-nucleotidase family)
MLTALGSTARRRGALLLVLIFYGTLACVAARSVQVAPEVEITLLSINDFHGALVHGGVDPSTGRPWGGALALGERIHRERERRPRRTFLFDAGDEMQGTPESNLLFGRSSVEALNRLGVDAAALGNHEFDWGLDTLQARIAQMRYPMLAANLFEKATSARPDWLRPTAMLERDGVRVGVIGLITPDTPRVTLPINVSHLAFAPADSGVTALARELRDAGADIVIALCHLGGTQRDDGRIEGPLAELARNVRGIDAILGGHRHTVVAGHVSGIPIVSASSRGRALGRVTLFWNGARVTRSDVAALPVYADSIDGSAPAGLPAYVDSIHRLVRPLTQRVIANAPQRLSEEALANLVADAMRAAVDADVALTNIGGGVAPERSAAARLPRNAPQQGARLRAARTHRRGGATWRATHGSADRNREARRRAHVLRGDEQLHRARRRRLHGFSRRRRRALDRDPGARCPASLDRAARRRCAGAAGRRRTASVRGQHKVKASCGLRSAPVGTNKKRAGAQGGEEPPLTNVKSE